jgi:DNA-binding transcriptional regulator YiaG
LFHNIYFSCKSFRNHNWTLTAESCQSFLRSTSLPIAARDYYLSKLFQFLHVPLVLKFGLENDPTQVSKPLEEFLDGIPAECTERLAEFDWSEFYEDTLRYDLPEVLRRLPLHLPIAKREPSAEKMTKPRWVEEQWPSRLKQARGADPQKVAAQRFGVSVETYKKWEQGARPPAPRHMDAVRQFTAASKSET